MNIKTLIRKKILQNTLAIGATVLACTPAVQAGDYNIGTGIYDITGPAAENSFFGWAHHEQQTEGIHTRTRAHAYIMEGQESNNRMVFVSNDLGMLSQGVKIEVVKRLATIYGTTYTDDNVMLSATHTHNASGGSSHFSLYQLAAGSEALVTGGYSKETFEVIVNGIVLAIGRAHDSMAPGSIELVTGTLDDATLNRGLPAHSTNHDYNPSDTNINSTMTVLKFTKDDGTEIGMINWFAVHPTGFSMKWDYLTADINGYAQNQFEKRKGTDFNASETFVAAFASSDLGDTVPIDGNAHSHPDYQGSDNELTNGKDGGTRLFNKGWELYNQDGLVLNGAADYRHRWADMENYSVDHAFTGQGTQTLCSPARGFSFATGGVNGPSGVEGIVPNMTVENTNFETAIAAFSNSPFGAAMVGLALNVANAIQGDPCQYPKPILLATGALDMVPKTLPFQVFMLGELAIVGLPAEITTMAGRRIRADVLAQLSPKGVTTVVIAGLSNTYTGYVATKEEFNWQGYEGAATEFGPNTLAAYRQEVTHLAAAINSNQMVVDDKQPLDRLTEWRSERPGVVWDGKYLWESFGDVLTNAHASYQKGDSVVVSFRGGHPKNNLRTQDTFLKVQKLVGASWVTVAYDWDWDTLYKWNREGLDLTRVDITWNIPLDAEPGNYRIVHQGDWKNGLTGNIEAYSGTSATFTVQ